MTFMDTVPILEGKYLTYKGYFTVLGSLACIMMALFCLFLGLIIRSCSMLDVHRKKMSLRSLEKDTEENNREFQEWTLLELTKIEHITKSSTIKRRLTQLERSTQKNDQNNNVPINLVGLQLIEEYSSRKKLFYFILFRLSITTEIIACILVALAIFFWTGFGYLNMTLGIFIILFLFIYKYSDVTSSLSSIFYYDPEDPYKQNESINWNQRIVEYFQRKIKQVKFGIQENLCCSIFLLILFLFITFFGLYFFEDICLCNYFNEFGISLKIIGMDSQITTQAIRSWNIDTLCEADSPPCQLYATLPEYTSKSVFINFHTHIDVESAQVFYDLKSYYDNTTTLRYIVNAVKGHEINGLDSLGQRSVFSALLFDLDQNTTYTIQISYNEMNYTIKNYKTIPENFNENDPVVFVFGGDVGTLPQAFNMSAQVGKIAPDFIIYGGDLSYDNGMNSCYYTWDLFFKQIDLISNYSGRLVPFFSALGNHDNGMNDDSGIKTVLNEDATLFWHYIPQHFKSTFNGEFLNEVPPLEERKSYFFHQVGNIIFISLDTGYVVNEGDATLLAWLNKLLITAKEQNLIIMINYHVPIYPICGHTDKDKTHNVETLTFWLPLFDKFKVMSIFENHVHYFKRTFPLRASQVVSKGTIYYGDGLWGVKAKKCSFDKRNLPFQMFALNQSTVHVWKATVYSGKTQFDAIDINGTQFDTYTQYFEDYLGVNE